MITKLRMSNLNISGLSEIGYSLPEGCSWETTSFVNGKKDGIFTVLDNEGIRIAKLEYHNAYFMNLIVQNKGLLM